MTGQKKLKTMKNKPKKKEIQRIATESRKSLKTRVVKDKTKYTRKKKHK